MAFRSWLDKLLGRRRGTFRRKGNEPRSARPRLEVLENRWLPSNAAIVVGAASNFLGNPPNLGVNVFSPPPTVTLEANQNTFPGSTVGINVATGDFTGTGKVDVVAAMAPGGSPEVQVRDVGSATVLADFFAFAPSFTGGVSVAVGDVNGDGHPDVIVGAAGGGSEVKVIDGTRLTLVLANGEIAPSSLLADFLAFAPTFMGGVNVAAGDVNGDSHFDIIVGVGGSE